jgi:hypothetical protein
MSMSQPLSILILGASYGLLPATKLALAGHNITIVGRPAEIASIAATGTELRLPARENGAQLSLRLSATMEHATGPEQLTLRTPQTVDPDAFDLVVLAMQEPQYAAPEVLDLMGRIAHSAKPCLSIMNMPPLPFLERLPSINTDCLPAIFSAAWAGFDPACVTLASPDPQAVRPNPSQPGILQVTLASNFKMAPLPNPKHQALLVRIAADVDALRVDDGNGHKVTPRVRFIAHPSLYVPLAKWPMLIAGNCRCLTARGPIAIGEAVWSDLEQSQALYEWVCTVAQSLGAKETDLVSFDRYAKAARGLSLPSSLARGLSSGAQAVERIDLLVQALARSKSQCHPALDGIVKLITDALERNRGSNPVNAAV